MRNLHDVLNNEYALIVEMALWDLGQPMGISGDGRRIVGAGWSDSHSRAWLVTF